MANKQKQRPRRPLKLTEPQERALHLLFEGRLSQAKVAETVGIPTRTLERWLTYPRFQAKLTEMRDKFVESLTALGVPYVRKEQRIMGLAQMAESARQEYEARPLLREVRPLPQKTSVRLRGKNERGEDVVEDTEPLDAIVNESFNRDAHAAYRDALSDIAAELGARKNMTELGGSLDVHGIVTFYMPQPERAPDESEDTPAASSQ